MLIGIPTEIKIHEYRVGLTPPSVREVVAHGHQVIVESNAGAGIYRTDQDYINAGAEIVDTAEEVFARADMVIKVKEPQAVERKQLREGQVLFTYLHLAPDPDQTRDLVESGASCIAYETVTDAQGGLPLLAPMSQVAGRMSIQAGAHCLERYAGGAGVLLGGVPGVEPAKVTIIGSGVVGQNAAAMAIGLGAEVVVLGLDLKVLEALEKQYGAAIKTVYSNQASLENYVLKSELVIGAVLIKGAAAPKLVTREMLKSMQNGAVIVDVAIDQGGCFETSRPTTHADPTYIEEGVVHYCVANMPGAVPRTSACALNHATLPFMLALADKGAHRALLDDPHLLNGLNVHQGKITYKAVADDLGYDFVPPKQALGGEAVSAKQARG